MERKPLIPISDLVERKNELEDQLSEKKYGSDEERQCLIIMADVISQILEEEMLNSLQKNEN
jgi:hypothetical protein